MKVTQIDNDAARRMNADLLRLQQDKLAEKDALTQHVAVLTGQNGDLSKELSHFVTQDELLRAQLDRRSRVEGLEKKNASELQTSQKAVWEARDRSPAKVPVRVVEEVRPVTRVVEEIRPVTRLVEEVVPVTRLVEEVVPFHHRVEYSPVGRAVSPLLRSSPIYRSSPIRHYY